MFGRFLVLRLPSVACVVLFCVTLFGSGLMVHGDWPRFRGPTGDGHVSDGELPLTWSETENIAWKVFVPGQGHSSPVIVDNQIWLTTSLTTKLTDEEKASRLTGAKNPKELDLVGSVSLRAICFDAHSGLQLHDIELFAVAEPEPIHYTNTYASPTPVIEADKLFVHFGAYGSACVDCQTGEVLWRNRELKVDHQNGPGSSPVICGKLMVLHMDGIDRQFIAALNVDDGSLAWRTDRSGEMHPQPEMKKAYCTPVLVETERGPELISPAANWVYAYNPQTGSELWKAGYGELGFSTVPCPVVGDKLAYICTSFGKAQVLAVKFGGSGDVTETHIAWRNSSQTPKKPSLLLVDQELIVCNDTGIVTCLDAASGEEVWRGRIGGNFSASPLLVGKLIYLFNQEGKTTVLRAGRKFEVVAENELSEGCHASAAVDGNALIVRTDTQLYRIETLGKSDSR